jgi:hypothetical protein
VTNTGASIINGDLGLSPGTAVTGFPPGIVNGAIHAADPTAAQAQLDLTAAYNDAAGRTVGAITVAGNLGGLTLAPGLYKSTSTLAISSGDLTLDAQGDANAVFIFQMGSSFTSTVGRQIILAGGAKAANIFWQVGSSATLGTGSVFKGNILALASITVTTGAAVEGRLLARTAAVTPRRQRRRSGCFGRHHPADRELHGPGQRGHGCGHQREAHRRLQRGDGSADDQHRQLHLEAGRDTDRGHGELHGRHRDVHPPPAVWRR